MTVVVLKLHLPAVAAILLSAAVALAAEAAPAERARLDQIQRTLGTDVPRLLCLDVDFATGAQPRGDAYVKAAASGFRSVVSLRTSGEGIDLGRERARAESAGIRFHNIPVNSGSPRPEQADEFLRLTREPANRPMLITCATANRVGAFMMILRVIDQGWSEAQALEEARRIGLRSPVLEKFAQDYLRRHKSRSG